MTDKAALISRRRDRRADPSPATDGDLTDGIVSVSPVHPGSCRVVLSPQVYPDLAGVDHPLEGETVVEVVVARPQVGLRRQQVQRDVAAREESVPVTQNATKHRIYWERNRKNTHTEMTTNICLGIIEINIQTKVVLNFTADTVATNDRDF